MILNICDNPSILSVMRIINMVILIIKIIILTIRITLKIVGSSHICKIITTPHNQLLSFTLTIPLKDFPWL